MSVTGAGEGKGEGVTVIMHACGGRCGYRHRGDAIVVVLFFSVRLFSRFSYLSFAIDRWFVRSTDRPTGRPTDPIIRAVRRCASERRLIVSEECFSCDRPHHQSSLNSHKYVDSPASRPIVSRGERCNRAFAGSNNEGNEGDTVMSGRADGGEREMRINVYVYEEARVSERQRDRNKHSKKGKEKEEKKKKKTRHCVYEARH